VREIILDTETTGLDPSDGHRIIEIGAVEMQNKVLTGVKFHFYINPERNVPQEAYRIHGISTEFLKDRPLFGAIANDFLQFIEGSSLVIHNAAFDMKFLNHELSRIGMASIDHLNIIDTLAMARRMFPGQKANLDALCRRFKVDNSLRGYHGALKDARLLAEVYVELCGGRQSSFSMQTKQSNSSNKSQVQSQYNPATRTVTIKPTEEELKLHLALKNKILAE
jgi:DNA polymerase-3 subunit epsilon